MDSSKTPDTAKALEQRIKAIDQAESILSHLVDARGRADKGIENVFRLSAASHDESPVPLLIKS